MSESPLRAALEAAAVEHKLPLKDLTVLAVQNDPFRIDTDARHRDGEWLAVNACDLGLGDRTIHLRGLHYMVIGRAKPNGEPYDNDDDTWTWLQEHAGKAARWLGYLPFEQIVDQRNSPAVVRTFSRPEPWSYITVGLDVEIPDVDSITPKVEVYDFAGAQPYKVVFFGEKSSLEGVLGVVADHHHADLYLPTGEISDTMLHQMAKVGAADGRPMVVLCFSDCDPAGWQMPISISRKLQALKVLKFPGLEFQVRRVALTPDQVREYGLPSTPLKDTEKRADRWRTAMGVQQTEIDALAALRPDLLRRIALDAVAPFYDESLAGRVATARRAWLAEAQTELESQLDHEQVARIRASAAGKLAAMRAEIATINDALRIGTNDFDLPDLLIPAARPNDAQHRAAGKPLLDSAWSFVEQTRRLIDSKAYRSTSDGAP